MRIVNSLLIVAALLVSLQMPARATAIVDTIDLPSIVVCGDDGSNTASFSGPVGSSGNVFITSYVALAWANAGVAANWLPQRNWNNTFWSAEKLHYSVSSVTSTPADNLPQSPEFDSTSLASLATNEIQAGALWNKDADPVNAKYLVPVDPGLLFLPDGGTISSRDAQLNSSAFAIFDSDYIPTDQQQYWQLVASVFSPEIGDTLELPPSNRGRIIDAPICWPGEKNSTSSAECKSDSLGFDDENQSLAIDFFPERIAIAALDWDPLSGSKVKTLALISLAAPIVLVLRRRRIVRHAVRRIPAVASRRVLIGKCA